jgi:hypothetical protein
VQRPRPEKMKKKIQKRRTRKEGEEGVKKSKGGRSIC